MNIYKAILTLMLMTVLLRSVDTIKNWELNLNPTFSEWNMKPTTLKSCLVDSCSVSRFMIISNGKIVFEYDSLKENYCMDFCRKYIQTLLYGHYNKSGLIDLYNNLTKVKLIK